MQEEKILKDKIEKYLSKYFKVYREVRSNDNKDIIDIIVKDKLNNIFGIEVKQLNIQRPNNFIKYIQQCQRYTKAEFKNFGNIKILMCPGISETSKDIFPESRTIRPEENYHSKWNSVLWHLLGNIGEVRRVKNGVLFMFNNKIVYDLRDYGFGVKGFKQENYNKLFNNH